MRKRASIARFLLGIVLLALLSIAAQLPTLVSFYKLYQECTPNEPCIADYGMSFFITFRLLELQAILFLCAPAFILLEWMRWNQLWQYAVAGLFLGPISYYWVYYHEKIFILIEDGKTYWISDAISDDLARGIITGLVACLFFWFVVRGSQRSHLN